MQDYKRIVSYIYAYEDNQKKNNVGFAKLEAKGGVGRLSCQLNAKSGLMNEELEVYFLHIGEYNEGIKIGECNSRANGQVTVEFRVNTDDIGGSGLDLSGMHGLYFRTKTEPCKIFASSWVEEDLRLDMFREYGTEEAIAEEDVEDVATEIVEDNEVEDFVNVVTESNIEEQPALQAAVIEPEPAEDSEEKDIIKTFFEALEKYEEQEKLPEEVKETDVAASVEVSAEEVEECQQARHKSPWERLCSRYPKVIAFENNTDCMCLKIDIKAIEELLGREYNRASNTFAIRSYMKHGYLLLIGNEKDREGKSCILGAPGIFNINDNRMAGMCGFKEFKTSKNAEKMNCRFGYWLKEIKL
ncbi:MAG: hypothetical protein J6B39_04410 [Lachnospiraceae bacterium]|nr:hypothetical protein [Lachnospiraceae bacterium]